MDAGYSPSGQRPRYRPSVQQLAEKDEKTGLAPVQEESVPLKIRFLRWLFPEINRRRAKRFSSPGLVAYYWTGGAPHCYDVANISATGLYLRTKERWAPETLIQMTLQKGQAGDESNNGSISVLSEVVRWGDDGTGFNFVLKDYDVVHEREVLPGKSLDRKAVEKFLKKMDLVDQ
jgi:c-di-GMP-binding flagellar brake protein YcgR